MKRMQRMVAGMVALRLWAVPSLVHACPVCFAAKNEAARVAFLGTTLFLTATPLILIGAVIYWLAARSVAEAAAEETALPEPGESPVPETTGSFSIR